MSRGFTIKIFVPSQAAGDLLARNANGQIEWKTENGTTHKELQETGADSNG
jgi:hypothetical protein